MTHHDHSPHDDADRLDKALDALMGGDHSGLDGLPPDMAATVSRLMWLSHEGADDSEAAPSNTRSRKSMTEPHPAIALPDHRPAMPSPSASPAGVPVSRRTQKAAVRSAEPASRQEDVIRDPSGMSALLRVAAILLVISLAGGSIYGIITLRDQAGFGGTSTKITEGLELQQLQPERCTVKAVNRAYALEILADIDVERDEALRRATLLRPVELTDGEVDEFVQVFVEWQSCRRFGFTYEAMSLQAPHFTREDFYGESTLDFRGPVETAYSDNTLNEMLDRREELDATSRLYWENAGHYPSPAETLVPGGEAFATDDGQFVAIRALTWDMDDGEWTPTTTVVVFRFSDGEYKVFDIQSTPIGTPPYL